MTRETLQTAPGHPRPGHPRPGLPVSVADVLAGLSPQRTVELETRYGNGDLIKVLDILGIGGPFTRLSPWELQDERGRHLINAGGYAALPFGEMYEPLVRFVKQYLETNTAMSLPQQAASAWRAGARDQPRRAAG